MELSFDIAWITLLLSITSGVIGYFALSPLLYDPSSRVVILNGGFLNLKTGITQEESYQHRNLGYIRRRKPTHRVKLNPVSLAEEAPLNPLSANQSLTKTREEFQCIHGFIQSQLFCIHCSPSSSSSLMTGV